MSKTNSDVPLTKDGHPDRRTVAGREAAAAEGEASPRKGKDGVPLTKDGHPDRRTVEGREAAERQSEKSSGHHQFEEGDAVVFNIGSNNLHGTISRVITKDSEVDGRVAHGSKDEPRYAVKYEGTGVEQIRTEGALKKDESQSTSPASTRSSDSDKSRSDSDKSRSDSGRKDDRYRKGHKFEEGETVVFHIGKQTLHGKIAKVAERSGDYKVTVGDDTITAKEKELEKDDKSSSSSGSKSGDNHKFSEGDSVTFNIGLNDLHGTITRVITDEDVVDGRVAHGSKDEPRYAVQYEGTGVEQIRTEGALKKDDEGKMDEDKSNKRKREEESKDNKDSKDNKSSSNEPSPKKAKN